MIDQSNPCFHDHMIMEARRVCDSLSS